MIAINLLPWREKLRKKMIKNFFIFLLLGAFSTFFLILTVHFFVYYKFQFQLKINNKLLNKIKFLDKDIEVVDRLMKEKTIFENHVKILESLDKKRYELIILMSEFSKIFPDKAYLKKIICLNNKLSFLGRATSSKQITYLIKNLENSDFFVNPILKEIKKINKRISFTNEFNLNVEWVQ